MVTMLLLYILHVYDHTGTLHFRLTVFRGLLNTFVNLVVPMDELPSFHMRDWMVNKNAITKGIGVSVQRVSGDRSVELSLRVIFRGVLVMRHPLGQALTVVCGERPYLNFIILCEVAGVLSYDLESQL